MFNALLRELYGKIIIDIKEKQGVKHFKTNW